MQILIRDQLTATFVILQASDGTPALQLISSISYTWGPVHSRANTGRSIMIAISCIRSGQGGTLIQALHQLQLHNVIIDIVFMGNHDK